MTAQPPTTEEDAMNHARVVHVRDKIEGAVYIGRAMPRLGLKGSPFANPYKIKPTVDRASCLILYEQHLHTHPELWALMPTLRGKPLACWCRHDGEDRTEENRCHGDALAMLVNGLTDEQLVELSKA